MEDLDSIALNTDYWVKTHSQDLGSQDSMPSARDMILKVKCTQIKKIF